MTTRFPRRFADRLSLGMLGLTSLATALVYDSLPARIATHFDWRGNADSWQPRALAATLLPGLAVGLLALLRFVPRGRGEGAPWAATATVAFLCTIHALVLGHARNAGLDVVNGTTLACGIFFSALGLFLPKLKQNPWVGARTYWTLRSPEVWARTQRVVGAGFFLGGHAITAVSLLAPRLGLATLLGTVTGVTVLSYVYSWRASLGRA